MEHRLSVKSQNAVRLVISFWCLMPSYMCHIHGCVYTHGRLEMFSRFCREHVAHVHPSKHHIIQYLVVNALISASHRDTKLRLTL
eukprot:5220003-Amphidinium_carterae.2